MLDLAGSSGLGSLPANFGEMERLNGELVGRSDRFSASKRLSRYGFLQGFSLAWRTSSVALSEWLKALRLQGVCG